MAATSPSPLSSPLPRSLLLLFLLLSIFISPSQSEPSSDQLTNLNHRFSTKALLSAQGGGRRASSTGSRRRNLIPNCNEILNSSHCSSLHSSCRWCRSEALDDMCFRRAEAWRLPSQVFSCDQRFPTKFKI
ncbi:hypothetical protein Dimus_021939 [Dionaea muscipula]